MMTIAGLFTEIGKWPAWVLLVILFARLWAPIVIVIIAAVLNWTLWAIGILGGKAYRLGRQTSTESE